MERNLENIIRGIVREELEKYKKGIDIVPHHSVTNPFCIYENISGSPLMEGYFATYPIEKVKAYLQKKYGEAANIIIFDNENGEKVFRVITGLSDYNKKIIDKDMSMAGYFPSYIQVNGNCYDIQYEPRHQNRVNEIVDDEEYIYHLTPSNKVNKILQMGLCPKTNNKMFNYPDRIYFFLHEPENEDCQNLIYQFRQAEKEKYFQANKTMPYKEYALLKVDTEKIKGKNFFFDPNAEECVYTKENIPPEAIEVERIINF